MRFSLFFHLIFENFDIFFRFVLFCRSGKISVNQNKPEKSGKSRNISLKIAKISRKIFSTLEMKLILKTLNKPMILPSSPLIKVHAMREKGANDGSSFIKAQATHGSVWVMENSFGLIKACSRRSYAIKRNASKNRPWPTQICEKLSLSRELTT